MFGITLGLSSPSQCIAMATIHFSTTVASFYFSGLIMTKYQKDSCILDVLPSMVNKGLIIVDCHGYELMDNKAIRGESKRSFKAL